MKKQRHIDVKYLVQDHQPLSGGTRKSTSYILDSQVLDPFSSNYLFFFSSQFSPLVIINSQTTSNILISTSHSLTICSPSYTCRLLSLVLPHQTFFDLIQTLNLMGPTSPVTQPKNFMIQYYITLNTFASFSPPVSYLSGKILSPTKPNCLLTLCCCCNSKTILENPSPDWLTRNTSLVNTLLHSQKLICYPFFPNFKHSLFICLLSSNIDAYFIEKKRYNYMLTILSSKNSVSLPALVLNF